MYVCNRVGVGVGLGGVYTVCGGGVGGWFVGYGLTWMWVSLVWFSLDYKGLDVGKHWSRLVTP